MGGFRSADFVLLRWADPVRRPVRVFFSTFVVTVSLSGPHLHIRDLLQWPLALPNDGLIDIAVQEPTSVSSLVGLMDVAPQGGQYWTETVSEKRSS